MVKENYADHFAATHFRGGSVAREMARRVASERPRSAKVLGKMGSRGTGNGSTRSELRQESNPSPLDGWGTSTEPAPGSSEGDGAQRPPNLLKGVVEEISRGRSRERTRNAARQEGDGHDQQELELQDEGGEGGEDVQAPGRALLRGARAAPHSRSVSGAIAPLWTSRNAREGTRSSSATRRRPSLRASRAQTGLTGAARAVQPTSFDFDDSHPALAFKHFDRTKEEEAAVSLQRLSRAQQEEFARERSLVVEDHVFVSPQKLKAEAARMRRSTALRPPKVGGSLHGWLERANQVAGHGGGRSVLDDAASAQDTLTQPPDSFLDGDEEDDVHHHYVPPRAGLPRGRRSRAASPPGTRHRREVQDFRRSRDASSQGGSSSHSESPKSRPDRQPKHKQKVPGQSAAASSQDLSVEEVSEEEGGNERGATTTTWIDRAKRNFKNGHGHFPESSRGREPPPPAFRTAQLETSEFVSVLEKKIGSLQLGIDELVQAAPLHHPTHGKEQEVESEIEGGIASESESGTCPQHARGGRVTLEPRRATASLADHLADAGPALPKVTGAEVFSASKPKVGLQRYQPPSSAQVATGAYDERRYEQYNTEMDALALGRAQADGFDSDEERDRKEQRSRDLEARHREACSVLEQSMSAETRERGMVQAWMQEDDWMAEYRTGEEYRPPAADPTLPARMSPTERILCDKVPMEDFLGADSVVLEELLATYREKNKHRLEQERQSQGQLFEVTSYHSDTDVRWPSPAAARQLLRPRARSSSPEHNHCMRHLGPGAHGDNLPPPATGRRSITPQPFDFDAREARKPKSIMQERLEQDLLLKAEKEEFEAGRTFSAKPVPPSTKDPRYDYLVEAAEFRRQEGVKHRREMISAMQRPFSFQMRDEAELDKRRRQIEEHKRKAPLKKFKARDVPVSTMEPRYHLMEAADVRRKQLRKHIALQKIQEARMPPRMEKWHEEGMLRPKLHRDQQPTFVPRGEQPLGHVPDFDRLHTEFAGDIVRSRRTRSVTKPQPFKLHKGRGEERTRKTLIDMAVDDADLPEMRWPFTRGGRQRVERAAKPSFMPLSQRELERMETQLARQRRLAIQDKRRRGDFDDRAERERRQERIRIMEAEKRADAWVAAQRRIMQAKGLDPMEDIDADDPLDELGMADPAHGTAEPNNRAQSKETTEQVEEGESVQVVTTESLVATSETQVLPCDSMSLEHGEGSTVAAEVQHTAPTKASVKSLPKVPVITSHNHVPEVHNVTPQHVAARLKQEEQKAKEVVEQILLKNDVYSYVEEEED